MDVGLDVDGSRGQRLVHGVGGGLLDGADGPVDGAAALLGDGRDGGDGVREDLLAKVVGDVRAVARDGRGGTDVGGRRHGRHVGRQGQEGAGAGSAAAGRADPDEDRDLGVQLRLDDVARGVERAAGRVELDDDGGCPAGLGRGDALPEVAGHDLVDTPVAGSTTTRRSSCASVAAEQQRQCAHEEQAARTSLMRSE